MSTCGPASERIRLVILNCVFHEQQLLIIVANPMSHAELDFFFFLENGNAKLL